MLESKISSIKPTAGHILVRVEIQDFSVFQISGNGDLKGTTSRFYIEAGGKYKVGQQVLMPHDLMSRTGGFLTDIDNSKGFVSISGMYKELSQKDREIYNKKSRINLVEYILINEHEVLAVID
jgi:hypothetical protein